MGDGTCQEKKSYCEAHNICSDAGGRLCTKIELEAKCTKGTGCGFDNDLIWSQAEGLLDGSPSAPACILPSRSPSSSPGPTRSDFPTRSWSGSPSAFPSDSPTSSPYGGSHSAAPSAGFVAAPSNFLSFVPSAPTALPTRGTNAHYVLCGGGRNRCTEGDGFLAPDGALHEVRCCSDVNLPGWTKSTKCDIWTESQFDGTCQENKSYCEAHNICSDAGGRLCTKIELEAKCTKGTGCGFDNDLIWSQMEGLLDGSPSAPACILPSRSPSSSPSPTRSDLPSRLLSSSPSNFPSFVPSAPTALPTRRINAHYALCGKGNNHCTEGDGFLVPNNALHEVRCCSDVSHPGWTKSVRCDIWTKSKFNGICQENKTYCDAHNICSGAGGRLCTKVELEAK